jgi:hypothetical protein
MAGGAWARGQGPAFKKLWFLIRPEGPHTCGNLSSIISVIVCIIIDLILIPTPMPMPYYIFPDPFPNLKPKEETPCLRLSSTSTPVYHLAPLY